MTYFRSLPFLVSSHMSKVLHYQLFESKHFASLQSKTESNEQSRYHDSVITSIEPSPLLKVDKQIFPLDEPLSEIRYRRGSTDGTILNPIEVSNSIHAVRAASITIQTQHLISVQRVIQPSPIIDTSLSIDMNVYVSTSNNVTVSLPSGILPFLSLYMIHLGFIGFNVTAMNISRISSPTPQPVLQPTSQFPKIGRAHV